MLYEPSCLRLSENQNNSEPLVNSNGNNVTKGRDTLPSGAGNLLQQLNYVVHYLLPNDDGVNVEAGVDGSMLVEAEI
jgi:hypothetical protein